MEENMNIKQLKSKTMLGTVALVSAFHLLQQMQMRIHITMQ